MPPKALTYWLLMVPLQLEHLREWTSGTDEMAREAFVVVAVGIEAAAG
jgi:hypothetical protein